MPLLPRQVAQSCTRRARRFLALAGKPLPVTKVKADLRRMAIVMGVAAVDSYLHALVLRRVSDVRYEEELPKVLRKLDVPFEDLAALADASLEARREERNSRPWVQVKNALQRRLLQMTFQSYDQVGTALSLAGVQKGWSQIADELGESAEDIRERLNAVVHRRNQIAHEGDMARASRPRRLKFNSISQRETRDDIGWIEDLIDAMEKVTNGT